MNSSGVSFKKTLGFSSLTVLASLVYSNPGFAMFPNQNNQNQSFENFQFLEHKPLTLDFIYGLILQAKDGDPQAQDELMKIYHRGMYRKFLTPETIGFLSWKSQDSKDDIENRCYNDDSYSSFVIYHFEAIGAQFPKLFEITKERADQEYSTAQNNLGHMYEKGRSVKKDDTEAYRYYKLAADQGSADAQFNLARMYEKASGVEQDEKKACKYYKLAADQGHARAQNSLGFMYAQGVDRDEKEACKYYKLAADQGHAEAQYNLGFMYAQGNGVEQDEKEACRYCKLAADQGDVDAQFVLGISYKEGRGVEQDEKEACKYYKLVADQGRADAQYSLGSMYEQGSGVEQDEKKACRYYQLAANQGHAEAQYSLGSLYAEGRGVKKNLIEALHWYIKSKEKNTEPFIRSALPLTPNIQVTDNSFQEMLVDIMRGSNLNSDKEAGLAYLIKSHQTKIGMNNKIGYHESKFAIPELATLYKPIEALEVDGMNMMASLTTTKPGFMVTAVSLSQGMKNELINQLTPFFSLDEVDRISYLTMGEENIRIVNRFVTFLKESDATFRRANKKLKKIGKLYKKLLEAELGKLMEIQQRIIHNNDKGSIKGFEEQEEKFKKLKDFLAPILKENKEECTLLGDLHKQIKSLPVRGAGSRNKDFLEKYPYL